LHWHLPSLFNAENFRRNEASAFRNPISVNVLAVSIERPAKFIALESARDAADTWKAVLERGNSGGMRL